MNARRERLQGKEPPNNALHRSRRSAILMVLPMLLGGPVNAGVDMICTAKAWAKSHYKTLLCQDFGASVAQIIRLSDLHAVQIIGSSLHHFTRQVWHIDH
jgi:hypothetical protein